MSFGEHYSPTSLPAMTYRAGVGAGGHCRIGAQAADTTRWRLTGFHACLPQLIAARRAARSAALTFRLMLRFGMSDFDDIAFFHQADRAAFRRFRLAADRQAGSAAGEAAVGQQCAPSLPSPLDFRYEVG